MPEYFGSGFMGLTLSVPIEIYEPDGFSRCKGVACCWRCQADQIRDRVTERNREDRNVQETNQ